MLILIDIPEEIMNEIKNAEGSDKYHIPLWLGYSISNGTPISKELGNYLIRRDFMEKLGATCIAKRSESGELVAICSIDNLPNALEQESALDEIRDEIKWIPVSEDLPKISDDYIITVFDPVKKYTFVTEACYSVNSGNWESDYLHFWQRVVAWKPYPEPYKKAVEEYDKIINKINNQYKTESEEK